MLVSVRVFEDVFPIESGDIPASCVSLPEGTGLPSFSKKRNVTKQPSDHHHDFEVLKNSKVIKQKMKSDQAHDIAVKQISYC